MSSIKNYVVIYDISSTRARYKLSRFLFEYGIRTQYSVFEVQVKTSQYDKFVGLLERKIKYQTDKIYIYPIEKSELKNIRRVGNYEKTLILDYFV